MLRRPQTLFGQLSLITVSRVIVRSFPSNNPSDFGLIENSCQPASPHRLDWPRDLGTDRRQDRWLCLRDGDGRDLGGDDPVPEREKQRESSMLAGRPARECASQLYHDWWKTQGAKRRFHNRRLVEKAM
jgi:hypothetical protein